MLQGDRSDTMFCQSLPWSYYCDREGTLRRRGKTRQEYCSGHCGCHDIGFGPEKCRVLFETYCLSKASNGSTIFTDILENTSLGAASNISTGVLPARDVDKDQPEKVGSIRENAQSSILTDESTTKKLQTRDEKSAPAIVVRENEGEISHDEVDTLQTPVPTKSLADQTRETDIALSKRHAYAMDCKCLSKVQ